MLFAKGIGALVVTLAVFTLFSLVFPKGDKAMGGLANAAVASFLVEAILKHILGDFAGIGFFYEIGNLAGSYSGSASAILVGLALGMDPIFAVVGGMVCASFGILPGFIAAYVMYFVLQITKYFPNGTDKIFGSLISGAGYYLIARTIAPYITDVIALVGSAITAATMQSPVVMGFLLGGIIKVVCTSPLSSMALTAMLQLKGLPMGIACIACFGGSFTNGMIFHKLRFGDKGNLIAVMLEPLTQAEIVTKNPLPIYVSNFLGGGLSGLGAAILGIICDAPGTASPIPGMLAPFAFNAPGKVVIALAAAAVCGGFAGWLVGSLFQKAGYKQVK